MADHIGTRVAYWRRRRGGMSQAALAGLAGFSQAYISQVESGSKPVERKSTLVALAAALQVTVADLLGQSGDRTDPARDQVAAALPAIRGAIIEIEEGDHRAPGRGRDELDALAEQVDGMRSRSEYPAMAPLLPDYLRDAAGYGGLPLIRASYVTSVVLRNFGYRDLALPAARLAVRAAEDIEHPAWIGISRVTQTNAMPYEAAPTTRRVAERALADLQAGAADPEVRQALGQLHLAGALAASVEGVTSAAAAHLAEAEREAATLGDPADGLGFNQCSFGPTNFALWQMSVDAELGEWGHVIERARTFTPDPLKVVNRHQAYWMTLGRALAHSGKTDREALVAFIHAERVAPAPFAVNPLVRDAVVSMVYRARRRSVSSDLRVMARRIGVDVPA